MEAVVLVVVLEEDLVEEVVLVVALGVVVVVVLEEELVGEAVSVEVLAEALGAVLEEVPVVVQAEVLVEDSEEAVELVVELVVGFKSPLLSQLARACKSIAKQYMLDAFCMERSNHLSILENKSIN